MLRSGECLRSGLSRYRKGKWSLFTVVVSLMLPVSSSVAVAQEPTVDLDPIRIVASPLIEGNVVSRYGVESSVVTERQIEDLNAQDITSALRRTPGVTIARYNPVGSFGGSQGGSIIIRGMGSSRPGGELVTLYDGVPRINPIWGHPILDIISIDPAESIQVYKAAQPQIFGNAHAAVNITPKQMHTEGFKTKVSGQYGSYNTVVQAFEHGGKKGDLDYYVGQTFKSSDGHRKNADGQLQNYYARLGFQADDNWKINWFGNHTNNFAHDPGKKGSRARNGKYGTWDSFQTLSLTNDYAEAHGHVKLYYSEGAARWHGEKNGSLDTDMDWETYGIRAQEAFSFWENGEILFGFDYDVLSGKQDMNDGRRFSNREFDIFSPYLALSHQFGDKDGWYAIPSLGLRQYWHSEFDPEISPHAGLIVGYKDLELHASYVRSVVYPALNVAILSEVISPPLVRNNPKGWKNLSAETLDHFEAGLSYAFSPYVKTDVTVFWDEGRNRYRMYRDRPNGPPAGFDNIDSYHKYGAEATVIVTPMDDLSIFAGMAYLETDPYDLPFAPHCTWSSGVNYRFLEHFQLSADMLYRQKMYTDSWSRALPSATPERNKVNDAFLLNAKLSYDFDLPGLGLERGEVFIAVENLTDTRYQYSPGYPMPGTTWMTGLALTF